MNIYTLGSSQKSAEEFFKLINDNNIEILIDVRLNNKSQLLGFTKGRDLEYFLKQLSNSDYVHEVNLAPTKEILDAYKKKEISWGEYEVQYNDLLEKRDIIDYFNNKYGKYGNLVLLCSEPTPENCHRRLLAEFVSKDKIIHL
ncbi:hypothetical protein SDC9_37507 [bioreactor metagenome]|uniref:DUF488 domain-containing protein n=1 Tax=bioreactor metagenome TaxID=1076179 RepID=A0A644VJ69_9ZZZZ|nr:DUF488 domain-containing protein [Methanobrevibacter sp.]MEA4958020.1 DUF488 domain-containing protein [Methanobrevibacter sp.]